MVNWLSSFAALIAIVAIPAASLGSDQPAARVGDSTLVPQRTITTGEPTVLICGKPAARLGDDAAGGVVTIQQNQGLGIVSVPSQVLPGAIFTGSATVLIGGKPAARAGDRVQITTQIPSVGPPPNPDTIAPPGCPTVLIGS